MIYSRTVFIIVTLLILGLASFIRLSPIYNGDTLFLFDHGRDLWDVKEIVYDGDFTLIGPFTGIKGVFNGAYHYYLLALPILLTNGHPLSGSYFNALLNILAVVGCFFFGKRMFGLWYGICCGLIFAFAKGAVGATVFFWNPNWIPALMVPFVYFLYEGVINRKKGYLIAAGFTAGIVANVEVAFGLWLLPVSVVLLIIYWPSAWKTKVPYLSFLAYCIHFIPHLVFDLRNNFLMTRAIFEFFRGENQSLGITIPLSERIVLRVKELSDATVMLMTNQSLVNYLILLFVVIVMVYLIINYRSQPQMLKVAGFFIIPILVIFLCFLGYSRTAWPWYWIGVQVFYYFLVAYLVYVAFCAGLPWRRPLGVIIVLFWFAGTIPAYFGSNDFLKKEPGRFSHMLKVVDAIYRDADGKEIGVYTYTAPIIDYAFSYVVWWRGRTSFGKPAFASYQYTADMPQRDTVYLIIEPSPEDKPWDSKGWEETKTPQGTELWRKSFDGRLILVKRQIPYAQ